MEGMHALMALFPWPCRYDGALYRLIGSLFGRSGPGLKRVKPRVEMSLEAINRRELLRVLVTGVASSTGEASVLSLYLSVFWSALVFGFVLVCVQAGVGFVICLLSSASVFVSVYRLRCTMLLQP